MLPACPSASDMQESIPARPARTAGAAEPDERSQPPWRGRNKTRARYRRTAILDEAHERPHDMHHPRTENAHAAMRDVRTAIGHRARPPRGGSRQPGSGLAGGAPRCSARPVRRPLPRARCAAGGPSCRPGRARCRRRRCGTRSGRARNTAPSGSHAHASRRYRQGRCPTRAGSGPRHASALRSPFRRAACRHAARPRQQRPSQNLITAASVARRRGSRAAAVADCADEREGSSKSLITESNLTLRVTAQVPAVLDGICCCGTDRGVRCAERVFLNLAPKLAWRLYPGGSPCGTLGSGIVCTALACGSVPGSPGDARGPQCRRCTRSVTTPWSSARA
jgi:hypothetical protein